MKKLLFSLLAIVLALGLAIPMATPVAASPVSWGDTLTANTTLDSDLTGSGTALIIGADGITLDLNGYTLSGDITGYGVDNTGGYDDVTIKGGSITGFEQGIRAEGVSGLTLEDLSFSGDTGGGHAHVIDIRDGEDVVIQDATITVGAGSPGWAEAIRLENINPVKVVNVAVNGGWIGVNFAYGDDPDGPTNGVVKGSTFTGQGLFGVFIANSTDATVKGNTVKDAGLFGIYAGGGGAEVSNVVIQGNEVSGTGVFHGITLAGVSDSVIRGNVVSESGQDGIAVYFYDGADASNNWVQGNEVSDSGRYGISVRGGATNNLIRGNTVSDSGTYDLHWGGSGTGNTWKGNNYSTSNLP